MIFFFVLFSWNNRRSGIMFVSVFGADTKAEELWHAGCIFATWNPASNTQPCWGTYPCSSFINVVCNSPPCHVTCEELAPSYLCTQLQDSQNTVVYAALLAELRLCFKEVPVCAFSVCQDRLKESCSHQSCLADIFKKAVWIGFLYPCLDPSLFCLLHWSGLQLLFIYVFQWVRKPSMCIQPCTQALLMVMAATDRCQP